LEPLQGRCYRHRQAPQRGRTGMRRMFTLIHTRILPVATTRYPDITAMQGKSPFSAASLPSVGR